MKNVSFIKPSECDLGENLTDYYLEVSNIKKGEIIYECYCGKNIQLKALSDATKTTNGWICYVENSKGEKVELFMSADTKYVGISFFRTPQYLEYDNEKGYVYPII